MGACAPASGFPAAPPWASSSACARPMITVPPAVNAAAFRNSLRFIIESSVLPTESGDNLPAARRPERRPGVDASEPGRRNALRVAYLRLQRVRRIRIIQLNAIERIEEFASHLESRSIPDAEASADAQLLVRPALVPEVVVVRERGAELTGRRVRPCCRIQHKILVR